MVVVVFIEKLQVGESSRVIERVVTEVESSQCTG